MPLLLYPVLAMAFQQLMLSTRSDETVPRYRIAFASAEEERSLVPYWDVGQRALNARHASETDADRPSPYLGPRPELIPFVLDDPEAAVRQGKIDVAVRLTPPGAFEADPSRLWRAELGLSYRHGSATGHEAALYLDRLTAEANVRVISEGLRRINVPQRADPVRVRAEEVADEVSARLARAGAGAAGADPDDDDRGGLSGHRSDRRRTRARHAGNRSLLRRCRG